MPKVLSASQVRKYHEDGVFFPVSALSEAELARARAGLDELATALGGHPQVSQLKHLQLFHRWAQDLVLHPTVLDAVEDVIGRDILIHSSTIFWKHPHDPGYVSWHQDGYFIDLSELSYASAWLALSDSSPDNGCLRVVRGSHLGGIMAHHSTPSPGDNFVTLEIACDVKAEEATDVVLRPGEMSLHHVAIVHGSNPNNSDRPRIGFAVRYVSPRVQQQIDHYPVILARGEDRFGHYRIIEELPSFTMAEAIRAQQDIVRWVLDSRASSTPVPLPESCRLRCRDAAHSHATLES